ncbi:MAG TPA: MFS transporter [Acidimicrobiia bacterium]|nr:MFS transporter [Acidimicrobiia bacterium]
MQESATGMPAGTETVAPDPRRWITLAIMLMAALIAALDSTVLNVAIPTILHDFHTTLPSLQWVITGYSLTFAALLIISGRLGDIFGARRMFIIGAALFALGSLIASLSTGVPSLVLGEAIIEGIGASLMLPATLSVMSGTFSGHERATAFSAWGAVLGAAVAFGPMLGGFLTTNYSWRWAFRINVIVAPIAILGALLFVRPSPRAEHRERIDVPGALLIASGMFMLVFGISEGETYGWFAAKKSLVVLGASVWRTSMPVSIVPVAFVLAAGLLFTFHRVERAKERTHRSPLFAFSNLERPAFRFGTTTLLLMAMGQVAFLLVMSVVLQDGRGLSAIETGLWLVPSGVAIVAGSQLGNWMTRRIGTTNVVRAGLCLVATGLAACAVALTPSLAFAALLPGFVLLGVGIGFAGSQLNNVILSDVPADRAGAASGANTTVRMIGASLGIAIISAMLTTQSHHAAIVSGAHAPLIFAAVVVYLAFALSFRIPQVGPRGSRQSDLVDDPDLELAFLDAELTA